MLIHKITLTLRGEPVPEAIANLMRRHTLGRGKNGSRFYLTGAEEGAITLCQISEIEADAEAQLHEYLEKQGIACKKIQSEQIGINQLISMVMEGGEVGLCPELTELIEPLRLTPYLLPPFRECFAEATFSGKVPWPSLKKQAKAFHSNSLNEELERIKLSEGMPFRGHPVFYSIETEEEETGESIMRLLLPTLHQFGRLPANRVCMLDPLRKPVPYPIIEELYEAQGGGTVAVTLGGVPMDDEEEESIRKITEIAMKHRSDVLTIFRMPNYLSNCFPAVDKLSESVPILSIAEDPVTIAEAKKMLRAKAKAENLPAAAFTSIIPKDKTLFTMRQVEALFNQGRNSFLCTEFYPQYAGIARSAEQQSSECKNAESQSNLLQNSRSCKPESGPKPTAMQELQSLVGLTEAKRILKQITDYAAVQRLCRERGLDTEQPHLHMVFTGNPGTAKTTVARLTARILQEQGVLSKGKLVEVGRADLVGKYVGWTADLVRKKFKEAEDSVLFIDEAYSLLDGHEGLFGDEAINTIVQEMENRSSHTVVIFAGYREPMEKFLSRNPGLRSRISYKVDFPDYSEEELTEILRMQLESRACAFAPGAEETARRIFREKLGEPNFGNGRYARTLAELAIMARASRLALLPPERISDEALTTVASEDFLAAEPRSETPKTHKIGFAA